jgi:hypothetical protein
MRLSVAALGLALLSASAWAQTGATGKVEFNILNVQGLVVGAPLRYDAKFAADNKIAVPAPFTTVAPMHASFQTLNVNAPKPGDSIAKLNFASLDGKTLLENVQFVPLELPMVPAQQRLQQAADLLSTTGVQRTTAGKKNPTLKLVRAIKIGPYDAVEVIGTYDSDANGMMFYRMVGILNPKSKDSLMVLSNVVASRVAIVNPDDFAKSRSGAVTQNIRFIAGP